jgi:hypothetical protein
MEFAVKKWSHQPLIEYRKFGLIVGAIFAILIGMGIPWIRQTEMMRWALILGGTLMFFGVVFPRGLKPVYVAWMTLGYGLGYVNSRIILTVIFYLFVTPYGLLARVMGWTSLPLQYDKNATTYRVNRSGKIDLERPY